MKNNQAYIWDIDGTLLDSYAVIVDTLHELYKEHGIVIEKEEINRHVILYSVSSFLQYQEQKHGLSFQELKERYSELANEKEAHIQPIKNAIETLEALKAQGARSFIVTHRGQSTYTILQKLNMLDYFEEIITSKSAFPRKPAPDAINYLIEKHGLEKKKTYYVGDRTIDMECAHNAEIDGILFLPENSYCQPNGLEKRIISDLIFLTE